MTAQLASKMRHGGYQSNYNSHDKNKHNGHKNNKNNKFKSGGKNNGFNGRDNQNKNNGYNSLKNGHNGNNGHHGHKGQSGGYNNTQNNGSQNGYKFKAPESKFNWKQSNSYTENSNGGLKERKTSFFQNRSNSIDNQNTYKSKNILNSDADHKYQSGDKRRNSEPNFHPNKKPHTSNLTSPEKSSNPANLPRSRNNSTSSNSASNNQKPETDCVSGIPKPKISLSEFCPSTYSSWQQRAVNKGQISCGFHNRGNTCFLNSTIQVLLHTPALWSYLVDDYENERVAENKLGFTEKSEKPACNMLAVLKSQIARSYNKSATFAIVPQGPLETLQQVAKMMRIGRQEDAHEYLRYVLDAMHKQLLWEAKLAGKIRDIKKECLHVKSTTRIHRIFGGYTRSRIKCSVCKNTSDCFEPCLDLQLDLKNSRHIKETLRKFCKTEYLQNDNMYQCERCKRKVNATKQMSIAQAPQILTLQLKRFDMMSMSMFSNKLKHKIDYQQVLDISEFMSAEHNCKEMKYELYGVLVHSGFSCNSGHYYSYCKNPKGKWHCYNDSNVSQSSIHQVLNQDEAYLLFYNKITVSDQADVASAKVQSPTTSSKPTFALKAKIENDRKIRMEQDKTDSEKSQNVEIPPKMRPAFIGPAMPSSSIAVIGPQLPKTEEGTKEEPMIGPMLGPAKPQHLLAKVESKSETKQELKSESKPIRKVELKPKLESISELKAEQKPEQKVEQKPESKVDRISVQKNVQKTVQKPVQKPDQKSDPKPDTASKLPQPKLKLPEFISKSTPTKPLSTKSLLKLSPTKNSPKNSFPVKSVKSLVQYEDSSSTDSNDSKDSKGNSKRDQFLKRKQARMNKLGSLLEVDSNKTLNGNKTTPVKKLAGASQVKSGYASPGVSRPFSGLNMTNGSKLNGKKN